MKREDMPRRQRTRVWRLLLPVCLVAIAGGMAASLPAAYASTGTDDDIQLSTPGGGPGTHITATIQFVPSAPATYQLYNLSTDPSTSLGGAGKNGCTGGTTWSGAPIFTLEPSSAIRENVNVAFTWPSVPQPGLYWLCAKPLRGPGDTLVARIPFIVPVSALSASSVQLDATSIDAGQSLAVLVDGWKASDGDLPALYLLPQGQPASALVSIVSWETIVNFDANKTTFGFVLNMPSTLTAGDYAVVARGGCRTTCAFDEHSAFFTVRTSAALPIAASTALPVATPSTKPLDSQSGSVSVTPVLLVGLGGALLLAGSTWLVAWRRKRLWHP